MPGTFITPQFILLGGSWVRGSTVKFPHFTGAHFNHFDNYNPVGHSYRPLANFKDIERYIEVQRSQYLT